MKKVILLFLLLMIAVMAAAQTPGRPNWLNFIRTSPTTGTIRWSSEPSANVGYYYVALHPTTTQYFPPAYCDPNWNQPGGWAGTFASDGPGALKLDVVGLNPALEYYAYVAAVETGGWSWAAYSSWESGPPPPVYDCPEGDEVVLYPDVNITMLVGNANYAAGAPPTEPLNPSFVAEHTQFFTLVGAGPWTMRFETTLQWIWAVGIGVYAGPGTIDIPIPALKDQDIEVQFGNGGDPTLPVELSSFTATLTALNYVKLNWVTQSETGMLGYRVYRGESTDPSGAILITPSIISATNTTTTQSYSITDNEVTIGNTYWYWLESIEYANSDFHGPVSILVEGNEPPALPQITALGNIYPNPFRMNSVSNMEVSVKAGENGRVTIYNILGQSVMSYNLSEGIHTISWNGKDTNGRKCGSGVYFARLSTPSMSQTKKILIIK